MARKHVDFIETRDQPEDEWLGARRRTLSRDAGSGASTAVVETDGGLDLSGERGLLELYVIEGEIDVRGERLARGGYVRAERAGDVGSLGGAAARLYVMADPSFEPPAGEEPIFLTFDTEKLPFKQGERGGPAGISIKVLWNDESRGPVSFIAANVPRYWSGPEYHSCPEELFVIAGDVEGKAGKMTAGSYFWRPEFVNHGPYWSETGLYCFLRGFGELYAYWHDDADTTPEQNRAHFERLKSGVAA